MSLFFILGCCVSNATGVDGTTYFDVEEHYHQSEEYQAAMMYLDAQNIPRFNDDDVEYSLVGRINKFKEIKGDA
jgi:hypothetical protein